MVWPYGGIRLGGSEAQPEFSRPAWFAMLFSAGMGIGLMFYSVAEPVYHLAMPPHGAEPGAPPRPTKTPSKPPSCTGACTPGASIP